MIFNRNKKIKIKTYSSKSKKLIYIIFMQIFKGGLWINKFVISAHK